MINKSMENVYQNNHEKAKQIVSESTSQVDLIINKQFELMNRIIKNFGYHTQNDKTLLLNTMVLATIDEWFEADFERDNGKNNLDLDFEIIDMIHFIIQTGFLIIMEAENISFDDKQVIEIFKKKVLLGFDNINDFMSFKKKALYGYHFPYETPISKNMFFENIIYSFQYLLENIHWKTWKKYSKYTEQELNNILNYLSTLFVNLLQNMYIAKRDELSIEEFANYATELYVIKNIENFDRQDRGY